MGYFKPTVVYVNRTLQLRNPVAKNHEDKFHLQMLACFHDVSTVSPIIWFYCQTQFKFPLTIIITLLLPLKSVDEGYTFQQRINITFNIPLSANSSKLLFICEYLKDVITQILTTYDSIKKVTSSQKWSDSISNKDRVLVQRLDFSRWCILKILRIRVWGRWMGESRGRVSKCRFIVSTS